MPVCDGITCGDNGCGGKCSCPETAPCCEDNLCYPTGIDLFCASCDDRCEGFQQCTENICSIFCDEVYLPNDTQIACDRDQSTCADQLIPSGNLRLCDFTDLSIPADLSSANLNLAILDGANLTHIDFNGANLVGADLSNADLTGANLTDASLFGADLAGANLTSVTWSNTTCPDNAYSTINNPESCGGHTNGNIPSAGC